VNKGDIVLISFPFTDLTGSKLRPALILVVSELDIVVAFITSQSKWSDEHSVRVLASQINGLKVDSLVRLNKIMTIDKDLLHGKLVSLNEVEIAEIDKNLISMFRIKNS